MKIRHAFLLALAAAVAALAAAAAPADDKEPLFPERLNVKPPPISSDKTVRYDYDIVYVRTPRKGDDAPSRWAEIAHPALMDPGGDLMLLHPDGRRSCSSRAATTAPSPTRRSPSTASGFTTRTFTASRGPARTASRPSAAPTSTRSTSRRARSSA